MSKNEITLQELEQFVTRQHEHYIEMWRNEEDELETQFWEGLATAYLHIKGIIHSGKVPTDSEE